MKLIELYDGSLFECQMIKNLLQNEGIKAVLKDTITGSRAGLWQPGGAVKLVVTDEDYERARLIVLRYELSQGNE